MRYCVNCGSELHPNATFCTNCGTRVPQAENRGPKAPEPTGDRPESAGTDRPTSPARDATSPQGSGSASGFRAEHTPHPHQPSAGVQWATQPSRGVAIDWRALAPGLLRIVAAIALSMTALANWWTVESPSFTEGYDFDPATNGQVLPLIGCIGVTLAALVQVALLPQFLGGAIAPLVRFAVRAALCLPALVAVVLAVVTTLGGMDSDKHAAVGVTLLAFAIGFVLVGLDDALPSVPGGAIRWAAAAFAALGLVLTILSFAQVLGAEDFGVGKAKLIASVSFLFLATIAGLVLWAALTRASTAHGLATALACGVAISALTRAWIQSNETLYLITLVRNWHGAAFIALALALATSAVVSRAPGDTAQDDTARARRLTAWVVPGFGLAAVAALVTAIVLIGWRNDLTTGGETWFLVLMFITALCYSACAFLLRTHALGRLVAVATVVLLATTILITLAAAKSVAPVGEMFTEGAYLWLPLLAVGALTIPPSVRAVAGPLMPQQATSPSSNVHAPEGR